MRKAKLIQTCDACPSQWEGYTDKHEPVYIRYRWGYLSVSIGKVNQSIEEIYQNESFGWQIGAGFAGFLSFEELKQKLEGRLNVEEADIDKKDLDKFLKEIIGASEDDNLAKK